MNIRCLDCGFPYFIIDDVFDSKEMDLIWEELDFYNDKMQDPEETGSARDRGNLIKSSKGLFIDDLYYYQIKDKNQEIKSFPHHNDRSNILTVNRKIFNIDLNQHPSWFFKNIAPTLDYESTMISYYENSDYYAPHRDKDDITVLCWIYREPKKFEGGDLYFPAYDSGVRVKNNRVVIFPGFIEHGVFPVEMEKNDDDKKWGRYCITSFLLAKDGA